MGQKTASKDVPVLVSGTLANMDSGKFLQAKAYDSGGTQHGAALALPNVASGLYQGLFTFTAVGEFDVQILAFKDAGFTLISKSDGEATDRYVVTLGVTGEDYVEIRQGWAFQITNPAGQRLQGVVHLENNGGLVTLPGTSRLSIELRKQGGALIGLVQSDIEPNASGFFGPVTFDPVDIDGQSLAGTPIVIRATIILSGIGSGTHVGQHEVSIQDLA